MNSKKIPLSSLQIDPVGIINFAQSIQDIIREASYYKESYKALQKDYDYALSIKHNTVRQIANLERENLVLKQKLGIVKKTKKKSTKKKSTKKKSKKKVARVRKN